MNLEMKGKLAKVLDAQKGVSKAGKEWVKQSFVLDNGAKFNPEICFNLFGQEKVDMLIGFNVGDDIEVLFNVSSREYNGNYYTSADVWKMQKVEGYDTILSEELEHANNGTLNDLLEKDGDLPFQYLLIERGELIFPFFLAVH